jgi:outer membrane lipoprotein LolB
MTPWRHVMRGLLLAAAVLLGGCATPSRQPPAAEAFWSGRMGLEIQSQPPQSLSAAFELQGSAERGELLLLSPIGSTLAQLSWSPQTAHLTQGGRQWSSSNLDDLTAQLSGTALPLAALFDWLKGQASTPAGWQVDLSQWGQGRIQAERQVPAPAVQLKVVLER